MKNTLYSNVSIEVEDLNRCRSVIIIQKKKEMFKSQHSENKILFVFFPFLFNLKDSNFAAASTSGVMQNAWDGITHASHVEKNKTEKKSIWL